MKDWTKKVVDWKVKENLVIFYDKKNREIDRRNLEDVIKAFLWVESDD
jgi:hypothetical protein